MRHVTLSLLAAAVALAVVTPAPAQSEPLLTPSASVESRPVGAADCARDLVNSLSDLQHDIATAIPGRRGEELYQRARVALDEAVRVRDAIQEGAAPETLQRRLAQANRELQPLLDAVGKEARSLKPAIGRLTSIERRLEAAIGPNTQDPQAVLRQLDRLALQSHLLKLGARHVAKENPVFQLLADDVEAFALTVAEYRSDSQDEDTSWDDLQRGFHKVHLAWLQMTTKLEAWSPRQIPTVYAQVKSLAPIYKRLSRQLHRIEEVHTPSDIPSSVRPAVPYVP
jgi:hypothetical protein